MKKRTIVFLWTTVGLAIVLAFMAGRATAPQASMDIVSIEEITPSEYNRTGPSVREKTFAMRILSWFGQSPGETISSIEATTVEGDNAVFGGLRSSLVSGVSKGTYILYVLGGLCIVGGFVVGIWLSKWGLGTALVAGGIAIMAVAVMFETYPWLLLVGLGVLLIVGIVWYLDQRSGGKLFASLVNMVNREQIGKDETAVSVASKNGDKKLTAAIAKV